MKQFLKSISKTYLERRQQKELRRQRTKLYYKGYERRLQENDRLASKRSFH